ncbi:hypothetical protein Pint_07696 [Pistacia integerrima]|uniref:Uncharacterized protein n=1 Tax=Pistacia integerrima TaxID=434235 RepID=A0ACC0XVB4_9ROSI|nr:hypothetical protein Pint_07696 [Pistacia integerrima]
MQRVASSTVSIVTKAKPREIRVRGSTTRKHEKTESSGHSPANPASSISPLTDHYTALIPLSPPVSPVPPLAFASQVNSIPFIPLADLPIAPSLLPTHHIVARAKADIFKSNIYMPVYRLHRLPQYLKLLLKLSRLLHVFLLWNPVHASLEVLLLSQWTLLRMPPVVLKLLASAMLAAIKDDEFIHSRRKRSRTPTPGHYLGLKSSREYGHGSRGSRYRSSRDDYGYRMSPRRSPYRGGRDYSPVHSPHDGRSRRDRSRSLPHSPYGSPVRRYSRGSRTKETQTDVWDGFVL